MQTYKRFAVNNITFTALTGIAVYFIFTKKLGIIIYFAVTSLLTILKYISSYVIVNKTALKEKIKFPYFEKKIFRIIFDFSFYMFLSSLFGILIFNVDSVIIGIFVSVAMVTVYNVSFNVQQGFRMINSLIGGPLFPALVEMEGKNEQERQRTLLLKGTKYMAFIFVPMVIIVIIFAKPLIKSWMGEQFLMSVIPAQILLIFWIFNGISEISFGMLTAKGSVMILFKIVFFNALANLALSFILVRYIYSYADIIYFDF